MPKGKQEYESLQLRIEDEDVLGTMVYSVTLSYQYWTVTSVQETRWEAERECFRQYMLKRWGEASK